MDSILILFSNSLYLPTRFVRQMAIPIRIGGLALQKPTRPVFLHIATEIYPGDSRA